MKKIRLAASDSAKVNVENNQIISASDSAKVYVENNQSSSFRFSTGKC